LNFISIFTGRRTLSIPELDGNQLSPSLEYVRHAFALSEGVSMLSAKSEVDGRGSAVAYAFVKFVTGFVDLAGDSGIVAWAFSGASL
jgi:hypothetical protein